VIWRGSHSLLADSLELEEVGVELDVEGDLLNLQSF
jgi:hypothetical protein